MTLALRWRFCYAGGMIPTKRPWLNELLRLSASGATLHVTDTETTGSSSRVGRVIEIATVSVRSGAVVGRFETLVDPGVPVPAMITALTGISRSMLEGAPGPAEAIAAWDAYLGCEGHFVAHNAPFDWAFLKAEYQRQGRDWPFEKRFCTVQLARTCLPALPSRSLDALIAYFGLRVDARHRALGDAEATAEVLIRLLAQLEAEPQAPTWVQPSLLPADD